MNVSDICKKYDIINYTINDDGSIDVNGNVNLDQYGLKRIPLDFNRVDGNFSCSDNYLTDLKGCPKFVGGYFNCRNNYLSSLENGPESVDLNYHCENQKITNLNGYPKKLGGSFYCLGNPIGSIFFVADQHFLYTFHFYKIIKDDTVNLKRLKYVMNLYDEIIDLEEIKKYYKLV